MPILHVASAEGDHQPGHILRAARGDQQVHMVRHEHVAMQGNLGRLHRFAQPMQEAVVILLCEEARFAIVPAQHDVQRLTREMDAGSALHA